MKEVTNNMIKKINDGMFPLEDLKQTLPILKSSFDKGVNDYEDGMYPDVPKKYFEKEFKEYRRLIEYIENYVGDNMNKKNTQNKKFRHINVKLSNKLYERIEKLVDEGEALNVSDFTRMCLYEEVIRREADKNEKR